jgi:hypothetical protein
MFYVIFIIIIIYYYFLIKLQVGFYTVSVVLQ